MFGRALFYLFGVRHPETLKAQALKPENTIATPDSYSSSPTISLFFRLESELTRRNYTDADGSTDISPAFLLSEPRELPLRAY